MKKWLPILLLNFAGIMDVNANYNDSSLQLISLSQQLLLAAKTNNSTDAFVQLLATVPYKALEIQLVTDNDKKAFWINIYNAFTQLLLSSNPDTYKHKNQFFKTKQIFIAG